MELQLNLKGDVTPFVSYLKTFAKVRSSLLLEIDTNENVFVSKVYSEDRASVLYSAITFEDCNITVISHEGENELGTNRIKAGILIQLPKFIKIIERVGADIDKNKESNFNITINYDKLVNNSDGSCDYIVTSMVFTSSVLKMKMDGFRISEFKYLSDAMFNNIVFNVQDEYTLDLSAETISTIIKTSDIVKVDPRKDTLVFYTEDKNVYVKDNISGVNKQPNFVYLLGTLEQTPEYEIRIPIFREKFIQMMDKANETFRVILGRRKESPNSEKYVVDRILFDSLETQTKIVISKVNE